MIPNYELLEKIYEGRESIVYQGVQKKTGTKLIIKVLKNDYPSPERIGRFKHEYEISKKLYEQLPRQIIKPIDFIKIQNSQAILLEDLNYISLDKYLNNQSLTIPLFLDIAIAIVENLEQIHALKILHKDINPSNILINQESLDIKIIDFGISTSLSFEWFETQSPNAIEGTLKYISPEQTGRMNRVLDYRSDYYSLGMTFYEMITGKTPFFSPDPMELVHAHLAKTPPPPHEVNSAIPLPLSMIIMKLISKTPEERYQSAYGLLYDLNECRKQYIKKKKITPFELALKDVSAKFHISEKLYGRENEIKVLMDTFQEVSLGKTSLTLISGTAGIGKSALVNEIHKPIAQKRSFFTSGKCDQYKRNLPYDSLIQALQKVIQQIQTESIEQIQRWKTILQKAVGKNGRVITNVLPQAKILLGEQPELDEVDSNEAIMRFRMVFQNFIQALVIDKKPLTIFFDDIQWIDHSTLELLSYLLTDKFSHHLFIIGAYRNNEINEHHPLSLLMDELHKQNIPFKTIQIQPLKLHHIEELLEETLHSTLQLVHPLAELCFYKTHGNPFFLNRILHSFYEDKSIYFNSKKGIWEWNLERIQKTEIADNVVELMSAKIQKLTPLTQNYLQYASCIGSSFDLKILAKITNKTLKETLKILWEAIQEGLIIPENENYKFVEEETLHSIPFRFLHDRVQQAVYTKLSPESVAHLNYKIAKAFLSYYSEQEIEDHLFDIANHYNQGISFLNKEEKKELFEINFKAGHKALKSSIFSLAVTFYKNAQILSPLNAWEEIYEKNFQLYLSYGKALHASTDYALGEIIARETVEKAKVPLEKAEALSMLCLFLIETRRIEESIATGLTALRILGINLKEKPSKLRVLKELLIYKWKSKNLRMEDLHKLPRIKDPRIKLIFKIMDHCDVPAYYLGDQNLVALLSFTKLNLTLQHGISESTSNSFMAYAVFLSITENLNAAYDYSQLALKLSEKIENKFYRARALVLYGHMCGGWHQHFKTLRPFFVEATNLARQTGDPLTYRLGLMFAFKWDPEISLEQAVLEGKRNLEFVKQTKSPFSVEGLKMLYGAKSSLCGQTPSPFNLNDEEFDEQKSIEIMTKLKFITGLALFYHERFILHFHLDDLTTSYTYFKKLNAIMQANLGGNFQIEYTFYAFYLLSMIYPQLKGMEKGLCWYRMKRFYNSVRKWSIHCPINFLHHATLMEAEIANHLGDFEKACMLYNKAIQQTRDHEYNRYEALANELTARFYLKHHLPDLAKFFLHDARYCYQKWGASAKVKLLEEKFPDLLPPLKSPLKPLGHSTNSATTTTSEQTTFEVLDFISVMKASQTITREIHLHQLIKKMMHIVIENAGAEKGYLLLEHQGQLEIEAIAQHDYVQIYPDLHVENLPKLIIQNVLASKTPIVLDDAAQDENYKKDPYIIKHQSKSILCFPLLNLGALKGLLYLENNLARGIFTQERLDVINLLSSQMAISIDNARFYAQLENKVEERTKELKEAQNQLIQKEKMAYLGLLTTGVGHEMKNPLNFIINFAKLSKELIEDITKELKEKSQLSLKEFPEVLLNLNTLQDNTESIHQQGMKADTIVNRMVEHSTIKGKGFVLTDLHQLLEQTVKVVKEKNKELFKYQPIQIENKFDFSIPLIQASDIDLQVVFLNLMDNAIYSTIQKKELNPSYQPLITITTLNLGSHFEIHIKDNGLGIDQQYYPKIFTPFFTTRPTGQGVGLGLSLSHNIIVKEHQGNLEFQTQVGEYTDFTISLPAELASAPTMEK